MSDLGQDPRGSWSAAQPTPPGHGDVVTVGRQYEVAPGMPLADLDQPQARAFAATDRGGEPRSLFALVCAPRLAPRFDILGVVSRLLRQPMLVPLAWDTAYWPPAGGRRLIIVFERPAGARVQAAPGATFTPLGEDAVVGVVVKPLIPVLKELRTRSIAHRALRADNLFFVDAQRSAVLLGECISAPAGLDQPAIYETIENMMALPAGRGRGSPPDDLYALGVLIAVLLGGGDPSKGASEQRILLSKINVGSYATLVGRSRFSLPIIEALRGLLCDEPSERWEVDDLEMWANGRHLSPKQPMLPVRGVRPFTVAGTDYWSAKALSAGIGTRWPEVRRALDATDIIGWVRRSIGDDKHAQAAEAAVGGVHKPDGGDAPSDAVLARLLIALDPAAPIRYREFSARLDGIASVLAVGFDKPGVQQLFAETVSNRLPQFSMEMQSKKPSDFMALRKQFETVGYYLARPRFGYGIERCLYELNDGWPCLSGLLEQEYVTDVRELLPALDRVAHSRAQEREPIDRHVAAFVCARTSGISERVLAALASEDDEIVRRLGIVHFFAEVQATTEQRGLQGLAAWIARLLDPVVETYRNRELRRKIGEALETAVDEGNVLAIARAVDNAQLRESDTQGFARARTEFAALSRTAGWLRAGGLTGAAHLSFKSERAAAISAGLIAGITLLLFTLAKAT